MDQNLYRAKLRELDIALQDGDMLLVAELALGFAAETADESKMPLFDAAFTAIDAVKNSY